MYDYNRISVAQPKVQDITPTEPEWKKGFAGFADEMQALGGGAVALAGQATGMEGVRDWGLDVYERNMEESTAGWQAPNVAKIEDIRPFETGGMDRLGDWAAYHGTKGLANVASLALSGGIGGAIAKGATKRAVKEIAKSQVGANRMGRIVTKKIQKDAVDDVRRNVTRGAATGGFVGAFGMEGGGAFGQQVGGGVAPEDALLPALGVGTVNAALELVAPYQIAKKLGLVGKAREGIAAVIPKDRTLAKKAVELAGKVVKGGASASATEGFTEGLQELVQLAGERWAKDEELLADLSPEDRSQIMNAAAAGALVGGGVGGVTGAFTKEGAPPKTVFDVEPTPGFIGSTSEAAAGTQFVDQPNSQIEIEAGGQKGTKATYRSLDGQFIKTVIVDDKGNAREFYEVAEKKAGPEEQPVPTPIPQTQEGIDEATKAAATQAGQEAGTPEGSPAGEQATSPRDITGVPPLEGEFVPGQQATQEDPAGVPPTKQEAPKEDVNYTKWKAQQNLEGEVTPEQDAGLRQQYEGMVAARPTKDPRPAIETITKADGTAYKTRAQAQAAIARMNKKKDPRITKKGGALRDVVTRETDEGWVIDRLESTTSGKADKVVPRTVQEVETALTNELGQGWITRAKKAGMLNILDEAGPNGRQADYNQETGEITIYAKSLGEGPIAAVALHEGSHATMDELLGGRLGEAAREVFDRGAQEAKAGQETNAATAARKAEQVHYRWKAMQLQELGADKDFLGKYDALTEIEQSVTAKELVNDAWGKLDQEVRTPLDERANEILNEEAVAYFVEGSAGKADGLLRRIVGRIKAEWLASAPGQTFAKMRLAPKIDDGTAVALARKATKYAVDLREEMDRRGAPSAKGGTTFDSFIGVNAEGALGRRYATYTEAEKQDLGGLDEKLIMGEPLTINESNRYLRYLDRGDLTAAKRAMKLGIPAEEVRKHTGWFKGDDGDWRIEIDDSQAQFKQPFEAIPTLGFRDKSGLTIKDVFDHPTLFSAYPELGDVKFIKQGLPGLDGWFNGGSGQESEIGIAPSAQDPRSTLLHEMQHWIQLRENFAQGGNENTVWARMPSEQQAKVTDDLLAYTLQQQEEASGSVLAYNRFEPYQIELERLAKLQSARDPSYRSTLQKLVTEITNGGTFTSLSPAEKSVFSGIKIDLREGLPWDAGKTKSQKKLNQLSQNIDELQSGDLDSVEKLVKDEGGLSYLYKTIAGEIEARNTQVRRDLTSEERMAQSPEETRDVQKEDAIVLRGEDGAPSAEGSKIGTELDEIAKKANAPTSSLERMSGVLEDSTLASMRDFADSWVSSPLSEHYDEVTSPRLLNKLKHYYVEKFNDLWQMSKESATKFNLATSKKASAQKDFEKEFIHPWRDLMVKLSEDMSKDGKKYSVEDLNDAWASWSVVNDNLNVLLARRNSNESLDQLNKEIFSFEKTLDAGDPIRVRLKELRLEWEKGRKNLLAGKTWEGTDPVSDDGVTPRVIMSAEAQHKMMEKLEELFDAPVEGTKVWQASEKLQELRMEWEMMKYQGSGLATPDTASQVPEVRAELEKIIRLHGDRAPKNAYELHDAVKGNASFLAAVPKAKEIAKRGRDALVKGELITREEADAMGDMYKHWMPLQREDYDYDESVKKLFGRGQGSGKPQTRAGTSKINPPVHTMQNLMASFDASITAMEGNLARKYLADEIQANPERWENWFEVTQDKDAQRSMGKYGFIQTRKAGGEPVDIPFYRNGERWLIKPNTANNRAVMLSNAIQNLDSQELGPVFKMMNKVNSWIRWTNISASPAFLLMNAPRDYFTAMLNLKGTELADFTKDVRKEVGPSLKALNNHFRKGIDDPEIREWEGAGGRISFVESLRPNDETWGSLEAQIKHRQGGFNFGPGMEANFGPGVGVAVSKGRDFLERLETINIMTENVMRYSTWKVAKQKFLDQGMTEQQAKDKAALLSKDVTTNFDRKGLRAQTLGTYWLFYNATVQGNAQVIRNMFEGANKQKLWGALAGVAAFAFINDQLGAELSDDEDGDGRSDWDSTPEWKKEKFGRIAGSNVLWPGEESTFATVPLPWVFNTVWRFGEMVSESMRGVKDPTEIPADMVGLMLNTFNPIGGSDTTPMQMGTPTAADPIVQILENTSAFGRPLGPTQYPGQEFTPDSELAWSNTPPRYKWLARQINDITGGTPAEKGLVDWRPSTYKVLADTLMGGGGRFLEQIVGSGFTAATGKAPEVKDVPLVKPFLFAPGDPIEAEKYHERMAKVERAKHAEKTFMKGPQRDLMELQRVRADYAGELRMVGMASDVERQLKDLRKQLRMAQVRGQDSRVEFLKGKMEKAQERFNKTWASRVGN